MEHLKMQTADMADRNIERIGMLFPECLTERIGENGKVEHAIDFDKLRQLLAHDIVEGAEERYQFTWPDKRKAIRLANAPTSQTLRPCRDESVDFDNTQNLYIEGDNLDVLKLLRENYLGKVKMIYIDPPYNTGNDFVYNDDFAQGKTEFEQRSGLFDEEGHQTIDPMQRNTEANGRFHTDWLNMLYPRLKVARDLLSDDGVILISIDDNEIYNLRKVCNEIFGEMNFVAQMTWQGGKMNAAKFISTSHEYILSYAKSLSYCSEHKVQWKETKKGLDIIYKQAKKFISQTSGDYNKATVLLKNWYKNEAPYECQEHSHYCNIDSTGIYCMDNVSRVGGGRYQIKNPINGYIIDPPSRGWVYGKESDFWEAYKKGIIMFQDNDKLPILKRYLHDNETQLIDTVFYKDRRGARIRLRNLMGCDIFDFPKDETVLYNLIEAFSSKDSLVLDFFSGSATTAHAVMQLNAEDGGNRKFIMVQLPENTDKDSEAYKAGYKNICEIGKERIRRAGKKIKEENKDKEGVDRLDTGFRVLKLDSSNMADVYYTPAETRIDQTLGFEAFEDNIKPDRTAEDLLFQVMPECNLPLSSRIEEREIHGKRVFSVNDNYLVACFDRDIDEPVITEIAKMRPYYFVMRDASAATDNVLDNFDQIFNAYSKETIRRIL